MYIFHSSNLFSINFLFHLLTVLFSFILLLLFIFFSFSFNIYIFPSYSIRIIIIFLDRNQLVRWFNLYYYNSSFYPFISKIWNFQLFSSFGRKKIWGKQSRKQLIKWNHPSNQNIPYFFNERNRIRIACMQKELYNRKTHELVSQAISKVLTTGKVKRIEMEEAFLLPEVTQQIYDVMTINLNIDPVYITDRISWHLGAPFPDSINLIVKEYKMARNLNPIRIIVLGPPASGKTRVARYLVDHYDIHYIHVSSLIENTIAELVSMIFKRKIIEKY